jgi:transposase InsO family protein
MGRRGKPYDNAKAESFMKTLKVETVYPMAYGTFANVANDFLDSSTRSTTAAVSTREVPRRKASGAEGGLERARIPQAALPSGVAALIRAAVCFGLASWRLGTAGGFRLPERTGDLPTA